VVFFKKGAFLGLFFYGEVLMLVFVLCVGGWSFTLPGGVQESDLFESGG